MIAGCSNRQAWDWRMPVGPAAPHRASSSGRAAVSKTARRGSSPRPGAIFIPAGSAVGFPGLRLGDIVSPERATPICERVRRNHPEELRGSSALAASIRGRDRSQTHNNTPHASQRCAPGGLLFALSRSGHAATAIWNPAAERAWGEPHTTAPTSAGSSTDQGRPKTTAP